MSAECPRSLCQFLTLRGRILETSVSSALKFINLRAEGSKLEPQGSVSRGNSISLQRLATERLFGPRYGTARFRRGNSARLLADSERPESTQSRECQPCAADLSIFPLLQAMEKLPIRPVNFSDSMDNAVDLRDSPEPKRHTPPNCDISPQ